MCRWADWTELEAGSIPNLNSRFGVIHTLMTDLKNRPENLIFLLSLM
jgi:hypothetical protein